MKIPLTLILADRGGAVYALVAAANQSDNLFFEMVDAPAIDDRLVISGELLEYEGESILVRHLSNAIGEIDAAGPFTFTHTATHAAPSIRFGSGSIDGAGCRHLFVVTVENIGPA